MQVYGVVENSLALFKEDVNFLCCVMGWDYERTSQTSYTHLVISPHVGANI